MLSPAAEVIACLSDDLLVDHYLLIEAIKGDENILGIFRDTVEDFTEYPALVEALEGAF
jgi:hypothetical protein